MLDGFLVYRGTSSIYSVSTRFSSSSWAMTMVSAINSPGGSYLTCFIAASQSAQQMAQMNPAAGANPFGPGQDPDKMFKAEAENLEVMEYYSILNGVEDRVLAMYGF